jgi:hypothetical protein
LDIIRFFIGFDGGEEFSTGLRPYDNSFSGCMQITSKKLAHRVPPVAMVTGFGVTVVTLKGYKNLTPTGENFYHKNGDIQH